MKTLFFTGASGLLLGLALIAGVAALWPWPASAAPRAKPAAAMAEVSPPPLLSEPQRVLGGYSGTQFERELAMAEQARAQAEPGQAPPPPGRPFAPIKPRGWIAPAGAWRYGREAQPSEFADLGRRLARASDYAQSLQLMAGLAGKPRVHWRKESSGDQARLEYLGYATRFATEPAAMSAVLFEAFKSATGCARQNVIFHVAQALPSEVSLPWLRALWRGADAEDSEDALCALAFLGDGDAGLEFARLARRQAPVNANRIVDTWEEHDALARANERAYLRSYRCIELLDGEPYFAMHGMAAGRLEGLFPWCSRAVGLDEQARRLLPLWLARYTGHPGSDDMAFRLARLALGEGRNAEALDWASKCATFPDQDMVRSGTSLMLFIAECALSCAELSAFLAQGRTRNRKLLTYVVLRRTAVEQGYAAAGALLREVARREPELDVSRAFSACWAEDACRGLDSGLEPLGADDPLKHVCGSKANFGEYSNPASWCFYERRCRLDPGEKPERGRLYRHDPPQEAVSMRGRSLAMQFRCWETLAELECRLADDDRPQDLRYKIAAIHYHEDVFLPVYVDDYRYRCGMPSRHFACRDEHSAAFDAFCQGASRYVGAARRFDSLAACELNAELRAKALFSAAMSWIKALRTHAPLGMSQSDCIKNGVARFEQLAAEYPRHTLADDAANAASYWRRLYSHLWNEASVSGK